MRKLFKSFAFTTAILSTMFLTQSCSKGSLGQDVTWKGNDVTASVPIVPDTTLHSSMSSGTFTYNLDSMIKAETKNAFNITNIGKVTLKSCTVTIMNPDSANNFANFQQCNLSFYSNKNATPANIASISNNPDVYATVLNIPVDNTVDLKSYLYSSTSTTATTVNYVWGGKLRRATTKSLTIMVHVEYTIHVQA